MADPRIKYGCPFCGEVEHLAASATFSRPLVANADTVKDATGAEVTEEVDGAVCYVCEAMAPLDVWNRERPPEVFAILRDFDAVEVAA